MGQTNSSTIVTTLKLAMAFLALHLCCFLTNAQAQLDPLDGGVIGHVEEMYRNHEDRRIREQQQAAEQNKLEEDVRRQQEDVRQGKFPRQRMSYEAEASQNPWARQSQAKSKEVRVELFVADRCPACEQMQKYLDEAAVPYARFYLTPGSEAEAQYFAQIGRGLLPVVRVNGKIVRGYLPDEVRKVIREAVSQRQ